MSSISSWEENKFALVITNQQGRICGCVGSLNMFYVFVTDMGVQAITDVPRTEPEASLTCSFLFIQESSHP